MLGFTATSVGGGAIVSRPEQNSEEAPEQCNPPCDCGAVGRKSLKAVLQKSWPLPRPLRAPPKRSNIVGNALCVGLRDAIDRERHRISRDLHDHAGQYLVGIALRIAALEQTIADPAKSDAFAELRLMLDRFNQELRAIALGGRPGIPFGSELTVVLGSLTYAWERETGIAVAFHAEPTGKRYVPDDSAMEALLRVAQEALTNIAKHAKHASHVSVRLSFTAETIRLAVEDDGQGLGVGQPNGDTSPFRVGGLSNMRERLTERGGRLEINRPPTGGTCVVATVPIETHRHRPGVRPNERSDTHLSSR